jgi:hypothetical protein
VKSLNLGKPYQEVVGDDPGINYRFIQDGVKFDNQGNEIVEAAPKQEKAEEFSAGTTGDGDKNADAIGGGKRVGDKKSSGKQS